MFMLPRKGRSLDRQLIGPSCPHRQCSAPQDIVLVQLAVARNMVREANPLQEQGDMLTHAVKSKAELRHSRASC